MIRLKDMNCSVNQPVSSDDRPAILHVVNSLQGGGTERVLTALLSAFDRSSFRHAVVTLRAAGSLSARLPEHVGCRALGVEGRSRWSGFALAHIARRLPAAVIHARNTGCWPDAMVASLLTPGAQVVLGFHGLESDHPFSRKQRRWVRLGLLIGARFTTVSQTGLEQLQHQAGVPADRIDLIRNGIDLFKFQKTDKQARIRLRRELQLGKDDFVVGTVGSLTPVKGHATLVRAVAYAGRALPNLQLLIVGDGPLRASLVRLSDAQGLRRRVIFTGRREDVSALLSCMDLYVCSSVSEGMSNALLEAMAAGLPIIATDAGDNPLILRHDVEGWIVPRRSYKAVGEALKRLVNDPHLRGRLATAARVRAGDYDFKQTVRAYESYYESLAGRRTMLRAATTLAVR